MRIVTYQGMNTYKEELQMPVKTQTKGYWSHMDGGGHTKRRCRYQQTNKQQNTGHISLEEDINRKCADIHKDKDRRIVVEISRKGCKQ